MTRRLTLFLAFLLLAGLLAPAHMAKAGTVSYYDVHLAKNSYVSAGNVNVTSIQTFEFLVNIQRCVDRYDTSVTGYCVLASSPAISGNFTYILATTSGRFYIRKGSAYAIVDTGLSLRGTHDIIVTLDDASDTVKIYVDGKFVKAVSVDLGPVQTGLRLFDSPVKDDNGDFRYQLEGAAYIVRAWNRVLSDSEIQQIYNDPLNPPTSGLVLWYAPDSVDTVNNVWHDKSGQGNGGSIVGATYVPLRPVSESEPSKDAPVALSFDGASSHIDVPWNMSIEDFTIVAIAKPTQNSAWNMIASAMTASGKSNALDFMLRSAGAMYLLVGNDSGWQYGAYTAGIQKGNYHLYAVGYENGGDSTFYLDGNVLSETVNIPGQLGSPVQSSLFRIGLQARYPYYYFNGTISYLLFYARALNSTEIRQIYENPSNPPLDGLVLWYDPYSYDPSTGKWLNRAPIFPTINLTEELDGVNYGATPERVSIPSASYYNAVNSSPISPLNVSVAMTYNNTTTSLIPSFLTLPWNSTVTLNVSATGYESRTLSILTTINSLAVYLQPLQSNTTTNPIQPPTETIPSAFKISNNYNDQGLWGGRLGIYFLTGNWSEGFRRFWTLNPMFELVLPVIFAFGIILSSYLVTRKPLVPVGTTAVMATFFGMLGIPLQLSIATPLAALFIFWLVYILWGFYKRFERS